MNHKAIILHESEQQYSHRGYCLHLLDDSHFEALNSDGHVSGLNGYCLDALNMSPAGSMEPGYSHPSIKYTERGYSLRETDRRNALMAKLIAEILAEETQK